MKRILSLLLCAAMLCMLFSGCSKKVEVDTTGLQKITFTGEMVAHTTKDYTATLSPERHHSLPETIQIIMDGEVLSEGYAYDAETGVLTIPGDLVTGPFSLSGQARESIVGSWSGTWDVSAAIREGLSGIFPVADELFNDLEFQLDVKFQFRENGTCVMSVVAESVQNAFDKLVPHLIPLVSLVVEMQLKAEGYDISVDEFLKLANTSLEEIIRENLNYDSFLQSIGKLDEEAAYLIQDERLYLGDDLESDPLQGTAVQMTLENGVLTLDNMEGEPVNPILPLTLTRVAG